MKKNYWSTRFKAGALIFGVLVLLGFIVAAIGCPDAFAQAAPYGGMGLLFALIGVTSTSGRFQDVPCKVVVSNNFETSGTITRSSIAHLTPADLENLFRPGGLFADMQAWFQTSFEMQACGVKINGMY